MGFVNNLFHFHCLKVEVAILLQLIFFFPPQDKMDAFFLCVIKFEAMIILCLCIVVNANSLLKKGLTMPAWIDCLSFQQKYLAFYSYTYLSRNPGFSQKDVNRTPDLMMIKVHDSTFTSQS